MGNEKSIPEIAGGFAGDFGSDCGLMLYNQTHNRIHIVNKSDRRLFAEIFQRSHNSVANGWISGEQFLEKNLSEGDGKKYVVRIYHTSYSAENFIGDACFNVFHGDDDYVLVTNDSIALSEGDTHNRIRRDNNWQRVCSELS